MVPLSRRHFLIATGLSTAAARLRAQDPYAEDVILRAMKDELERSRQLRHAAHVSRQRRLPGKSDLASARR